MADVRAAVLNAALEADRLHKRFGMKERVEAGEGRITGGPFRFPVAAAGQARHTFGGLSH
jgi:hypothetical protein